MNARPIIPFVLLLAACGGGEGGGGGKNEIDGKKDGVSANGVWFGDLTQDGFDHDYLAMIHDGRIMLINYNFGVGYDGSYTVDGETISANLTQYVGPRDFIVFSLSGEVSEESTISALLEHSSGSQASVQLTFLEEYHRSSSLSLLEGVWDDSLGILAHPARAFTTELTIGADGFFSGMDDNFCSIGGNINIIDNSINLYEVNIVLSGCPDSGIHTGFARLVDFDPHDMLAIVAFDERHNEMVYYNLGWSEVSNGGALTNSVSVDNLSGTAGSRTHYTFTVSEEDLAAAGPDPEFQVTTSGGTGDVDLYARFEDVPSIVTAFACFWFDDPGNDENCDFNVAKAGTFHVILHADSDYSGVSLTASFN